MDFIEKYLGLSPDGGDGSMEIMLLVLLVLVGIAIWMHLPNRRKNQNDENRRKKRY